jgi:hypothetical protein
MINLLGEMFAIPDEFGLIACGELGPCEPCPPHYQTSSVYMINRQETIS